MNMPINKDFLHLIGYVHELFLLIERGDGNINAADWYREECIEPICQNLTDNERKVYELLAAALNGRDSLEVALGKMKDDDR